MVSSYSLSLTYKTLKMSKSVQNRPNKLKTYASNTIVTSVTGASMIPVHLLASSSSDQLYSVKYISSHCIH